MVLLMAMLMLQGVDIVLLVMMSSLRLLITFASCTSSFCSFVRVLTVVALPPVGKKVLNVINRFYHNIYNVDV